MSRFLACTLLAVALLGPSVVRAQKFNVYGAKEHLPLRLIVPGLNSPIFSDVVEIGDIDGDGLKDIFFLRPTCWFRNDAATSFSPTTGFPTSGPTGGGSAMLLDADGDGDLDVVAGRSGSDLLWTNDGTGTFTYRQISSHTTLTESIAARDLDGDGLVDLVMGGWASPVRLYLNQVGAFTDVTGSQMPATMVDTEGLAFADVDGDQDPDLLVVDFNELFVYENDGQGSFTDVTSTHSIPSLGSWARAVVTEDVDGDGDPDVFVARTHGSNLLLINDGSGNFTDESAVRLPATPGESKAAAFGDLDGDGDPDLLVANGWIEDTPPEYLLNDGSGVFTPAPPSWFFAEVESHLDVALGDLDNDGDLDVIISTGVSGLSSQLYLNDGTGVLIGATKRRMPIPATAEITTTAASDVNGDGAPDLYVGRRRPRNDLLFLNDGTGNFAEATGALPAVNEETLSADFGDMDGDGDLDLFVGTTNTFFDHLYENDGTGSFADVSSRLPQLTDETRAVAWGDVDADGDQDLVLGRRGAFGPLMNRLFINDGSGHFVDESATRLPVNSSNTWRIVLFDAEGDGDLDIYWANGLGGQDELYVNDGTGHFTDESAARIPQIGVHTNTVAAGDFDGDGDLDLLVGYAVNGVPGLLVNDGAGHFTDMGTTFLPSRTTQAHQAAFSDLDGDGDLDLILNGNILYSWDGSRFVDITLQRIGNESLYADPMTIADLDRDGDPDLVATFQGDPLVATNVEWQLEAPLLARTGYAYRLDYYAQPGYATQAHVALPLLGFALAGQPIALPLIGGKLFLDPLQMLALPPVAIPASTGMASILPVIPPDTTLVGLPIYSQALIGDATNPLSANFTGYVVDVIGV